MLRRKGKSLSFEKENLVLMGAPGSGKTSVSWFLSQKLGLARYDIDDDHLEKVWGCSVAKKLADVGDSKFVEMEGEALKLIQKETTVIALSGSNPLHEEAMTYIAKLGTVIYLDVCNEDIVKRLEAMKVDRIVGQKKTSNFHDILNYRRGFYEKFYDLRVVIPKDCDLEMVQQITLDVVLEYRKALQEPNRYISTRATSADECQSFEQVILKGLAADGGLYIPKTMPKFSAGQIERLVEFANNYSELALRILEKWIPEISPQILREMIQKAYQYPDRFDHPLTAPLTTLGNNNQFLLELYHGPTASFKDFALQLFPQIFNYISKELYPNNRYAILVSTSGDTGSATVDGFCSQTDIPVAVLFPEHGVSPVQKAQMVTSSYPNLHIIGVEKDFDFCQSSLKELFNNSSFTQKLFQQYHLSLSAANSINWGRLVPQIVYHWFGYLQLVAKGTIVVGEEIDICVPTGNYGNILSAFLAKLSGLPARTLICASNENNILTDFIKTGIYDIRQRELIKTSSPSIDILKSSNLERLLRLLSSDSNETRRYFLQLDKEKHFQVDSALLTQIQSVFWAGWSSEKQVSDVIRTVFQETKLLLDPHTSVAKHVANCYVKESPGVKRKIIIVSTAHPSKFPTLILQTLKGTTEEKNMAKAIDELKKLQSLTPMHEKVERACQATPIHKIVCPADLGIIQTEIEVFFQKIYSK